MWIVDSDNYAASGIETMFFPGGEPHVKVQKFKGWGVLHLKLRTWNDVGFAALVIDALDRQHREQPVPAIFIPYFPGARQDRSDGTAPVTIEVMARLLGLRSSAIWTFDPHSRATTHAMPHIQYMMPKDLDVPHEPGVVGIIAPDAGAFVRAKLFRDQFYPDAHELVTCTKQRDSVTGRLSNYVLPPLQEAGRYIVVDDICDGGGTFNLLAEAFKKDPLAASSKLDLFVSHGIFSKGLDAIDPVYEQITTTDSWCCLPGSKRLTVIPLLKPFMKFAGMEFAS